MLPSSGQLREGMRDDLKASGIIFTRLFLFQMMIIMGIIGVICVGVVFCKLLVFFFPFFILIHFIFFHFN